MLGGSFAFNQPNFVELIKTKLATIVHEVQSSLVDNIHVTKLVSHNGVKGDGLIFFIIKPFYRVNYKEPHKRF